jgi:serine/threonine protein phosphatase 1
MNEPARTIAIGDIHGCVHALYELVDAINLQPDDRLVVLGDYVDQGRDTRDVIDLLIDLQNACQLITLQGNHEEMLLAGLTSEAASRQWQECGGFATLNSYRVGASIEVIPDRHLEFIRRSRDYFETPTHLFVHAGYDPELPMDKQPDYALRWALLEPSEAAPHYSGKTAICGHTEQHTGDVLDLGFVKCIDTGCHAYGWLTALDVDTGQVWQTSRWGVLRG